MNPRKLRTRVRTDLAAAEAVLDSVPERNALVPVLVSAEEAPQAPQAQALALLLQIQLAESDGIGSPVLGLSGVVARAIETLDTAVRTRRESC
jgi:hypothetical protein